MDVDPLCADVEICKFWFCPPNPKIRYTLAFRLASGPLAPPRTNTKMTSPASRRKSKKSYGTTNSLKAASSAPLSVVSSHVEFSQSYSADAPITQSLSDDLLGAGAGAGGGGYNGNAGDTYENGNKADFEADDEAEAVVPAVAVAALAAMTPPLRPPLASPHAYTRIQLSPRLRLDCRPFPPFRPPPLPPCPGARTGLTSRKIGKATIAFVAFACRRVLSLPLFCRNTNAHPSPSKTPLGVRVVG